MASKRSIAPLLALLGGRRACGAGLVALFVDMRSPATWPGSLYDQLDAREISVGGCSASLVGVGGPQSVTRPSAIAAINEPIRFHRIVIASANAVASAAHRRLVHQPIRMRASDARQAPEVAARPRRPRRSTGPSSIRGGIRSRITQGGVKLPCLAKRTTTSRSRIAYR